MTLIPKHQAIVLTSSLESVERAEAAADALAAGGGFDESDRHRISMAVREITVNAVRHGNAFAVEKKVHLDLRLSNDSLTIEVSDEGPGFDLTQVPDPLASDNLMRQSGRGIFLARNFMDDFELRTGAAGTHIRMVKRRHSAETGHAGSSSGVEHD